jgi:tRNA G10  N-methylase Trm11
MDSTKLALRAAGLFDAIITDPPYGIRAMSRTVTKKEESSENC